MYSINRSEQKKSKNIIVLKLHFPIFMSSDRIFKSCFGETDVTLKNPFEPLIHSKTKQEWLRKFSPQNNCIWEWVFRIVDWNLWGYIVTSEWQWHHHWRGQWMHLHSPSNYVEMLEIMATLPSFSACLKKSSGQCIVL